MIRKATALSLAAAILLSLSACGVTETPVSTPTPTPSGPSVEAHWDVLETGAPNIANRRYEGYTDTLIPADDYGELVPYIGGESEAEFWGSGWFYGLATREGEIITDPVYTAVEALTDTSTTLPGERYGDALLLRTAVELEEEPAEDWMPKYDDRFGLAAMDGSWYTGQVFTDCVCSNTFGALFFDLEGDAVMLSGEDGRELWRWEAEAIPVEGLEPGMVYWDCTYMLGHYLEFMYWTGEPEPESTYVDLSTGEALDSAPEIFQSGEDDWDTSRVRYEGGWYSIADGMVSISEDSGAEHSFPLPEGSGEYSYPSIDGDRVLFNLDYDLGGGSVLTDLDGGELLRTGEYLSWLWQQYGETPSLPSTVDYIGLEDGSSYSVTCVYTRDGAPLLTAEGGVYLWGDRLLIADAGSYRLTDLGGSDLIRLTRWQSADIPAEE